MAIQIMFNFCLVLFKDGSHFIHILYIETFLARFLELAKNLAVILRF